MVVVVVVVVGLVAMEEVGLAEVEVAAAVEAMEVVGSEEGVEEAEVEGLVVVGSVAKEDTTVLLRKTRRVVTTFAPTLAFTCCMATPPLRSCPSTARRMPPKPTAIRNNARPIWA